MDYIKNFISDAGAIIILYSPVLLSYITQIIDWIITFSKLKKVDVEKQIKPLVAKIDKLEKEIKEEKIKNNNLRDTMIILIKNQEDANEKLKNSLLSEMQEQNKQLNVIVQDNVELRAALRLKEAK